jgi:hypothetical protein
LQEVPRNQSCGSECRKKNASTPSKKSEKPARRLKARVGSNATDTPVLRFEREQPSLETSKSQHLGLHEVPEDESSKTSPAV